MDKRKIIYTGPFDPKLCDGISGSTFDLLGFLRKRGHDVAIISYVHDNHLTRNNIPFLAGSSEFTILNQETFSCRYDHCGVDIRYEILPGYSRNQVLGCHAIVFKHYLNAIKDIPHAYFFTVDHDATCLMAHHFLKTSSAHFVRSPAVSMRFFTGSPFYANILRKKTVFTVSPYARREIKSGLGVDALVWPSFIDPGRFRVPGRNPIRKTIGYYSAGRHKGDSIVGRLIREMPDYSFVVMGHDDIDLGHYPNVTHLHLTAAPKDFYSLVSLLLVPSLLPEGHPRTIIEASYNGIPVIANRIGGIADALGKSGIMIDIDPSEEAMIHRYKTEITRLLENPDDYATYRDRALERASEYEKNIIRISADYADRFFTKNLPG